MCGIAGIVSLEGVDPKLLMAMTHLIKHRGPDGFGFAYFDFDGKCPPDIIHDQDRLPHISKPVVGLGNRRLAILDLSPLGNQPMQVDQGALCITYNGEIYNYIEVREDLQKAGYSFKSGTDTEVVLRAYQEWGPACLDKFNGMWGFALCDSRNKRLFCARDRFGVKPFYYFLHKDFFAFGSEIKQLLALPNVPRQASPTAVANYLEKGVAGFSDATFFRAIHELPASHFLTLSIIDGDFSLEIQRYWDLKVSPAVDCSEEIVREEFSARFQSAVSIRLRSDVPVGSCLSGGLDSSSIVCTAADSFQSTDFHTFTACFDDPAIDERPYVHDVVSRARVKPHFVYPTAEGFWKTLSKLTWHQDEPVGGPSVFAQWEVMAEARQWNVPVLLDGQGGDETLCGYQKYYLFYLWHLLRGADPQLIPELLYFLGGGSKFLWKKEYYSRYLPRITKHEPLVARIASNELISECQSGMVDIGPGRSVQERQKADLLALSLPVLLRFEDRNSMAHSIETRLPFLDYRLAEFLVNLPSSFKLRHGWTKWILRDSMRAILPESVRLRREKLGFSTPVEQWMKEGLSRAAGEAFAGPNLYMRDYLDYGKLKHEIARLTAGRSNGVLRDLLFRALSLEVWGNLFAVSS